jgi:magnesium-transporting ATPase (P-type)
LITGCFDQDVPPAGLLAMPHLHKAGLAHAQFNLQIYSKWVMRGLYHSFVAFVVPFAIFNVDWKQSGVVAPDGQDRGLLVVGTYSYAAVVFLVTIRLAMLLRTHTWVNTACHVGSVVMWFVFTASYSHMKMDSADPYFLLDRSADHLNFWLSIPLVLVIALFPDFLDVS